MNGPREAHTHRILVVDDNRTIHEDFRKLLVPDESRRELENVERELFGLTGPWARWDLFVIDSAFRGEEALRKVERALAEGAPYSLAFVDMRMPPGWDGIETIEHIWQVDPQLQVVICTAYSDHAWPEISKRLGRSDRLLILKKPFDGIEIVQMTYAMSRKCELDRAASGRQQPLLRARYALRGLIGELERDGALPKVPGTVRQELVQAARRLLGRLDGVIDRHGPRGER